MLKTVLGSVALIAVLILLSALFSGAEIAFASAAEFKLKKRAASGRLRDRLALWIHERYDRALVSILVGNNLVNIAASAAATVLVITLLGERATALATLVMTVLIITFGEITPKVLASRRPEGFARLAALPIRAFMWITAPVVALETVLMRGLSRLWRSDLTEDAVTEDDLETMLETAEDEGVVDEDTADLLQSALDFDDVLAYEVITHRVDMEAIDIEDSPEQIVQRLLDTKYSRLPVYEGTTDNIIGVVFVNHCLKVMAAGEPFDLRRLMNPPQFVHKTMPLPDVLTLMKRTHNHLVIVTDEYGGTMGILTMEDVLEQIVGEIWDEKDVIDEEFRELGDGAYEADGGMRIEDLFDELDMDERDFDDDNATLGGWTIEMLGGYPDPGDSFTYKNLKITVLEADELRVKSLRVEVLPQPEEE